MEHLGVHSTRLKVKLLAQFPGMRAYTKGRDILMALEDDVGIALAKACEQDNTKDVMHIASAAQIVRCHIFGEAKSFNGFPERCQEASVPQLLLTLVNMVLEGPSINIRWQREHHLQHRQLGRFLNSTVSSTSRHQVHNNLSSSY